MSHPNRLLIEGIDDAYVIRNLLQHHQITNCQIDRSEKFYEANTIVIQEQGGKDKLLKNLPVVLPDGDLKRLGIILDADNDLNAKWQSIHDRLSAQGQFEWPTNPISNGVIFLLNRIDQAPLQIGIWLMPDNQQSGAVEEFFSQLIPATDQLWPMAQKCVSEVVQIEQRFPDTHQKKAEIITWLAWQDRPGRRLGETISSARYLDLNALVAQRFVSWVRHLFEMGD